MKWGYKTLDQLGTISRGKSKHRPRNDPKLFGGIYPFIQTADVKDADYYITSYSSTYNELGLAQSKLWDAGTLCITIAANIADSAVLAFPACFPDSVIWDTATNVIYSLAATQTSKTLFITIFSIMLGVGGGALFALLREDISNFFAIYKLEKKLTNNPTASNIDIGKITTSKIKGERAEQKTSSPIEDLLNSRKRNGYVALKSAVFILFAYLFFSIFILWPASLNSKFEQDITMIYPYVENQTILQLKSDWVLMKSKNEYVAIYKTIDQIKEENKLPLT